jgi:uncharacterized protein YwqG
MEILIDEAVKWKIEAMTRKQNDQLAETQEHIKEMRRNMDIITNDFATQNNLTNRAIYDNSAQLENSLMSQLQNIIGQVQQELDQKLLNQNHQVEERLQDLDKLGQVNHD